MKNIILFIGFFVFLFIQSAFPQTQNYYDTIAWVWVNDESFFAKEGDHFSDRNDLNSALSSNSVTKYSQAFPFAKNSELHKVHEIRCNSNGSITSVINELLSKFPDVFDRVSYFEDGLDTVLVYDPIDEFWVTQADGWLWHLKKIQAELAWDITRGDPMIKTAVLDTKFDFTSFYLCSKC